MCVSLELLYIKCTRPPCTTETAPMGAKRRIGGSTCSVMRPTAVDTVLRAVALCLCLCAGRAFLVVRPPVTTTVGQRTASRGEARAGLVQRRSGHQGQCLRGISKTIVDMSLSYTWSVNCAEYNVVGHGEIGLCAVVVCMTRHVFVRLSCVLDSMISSMTDAYNKVRA